MRFRLESKHWEPQIIGRDSVLCLLKSRTALCTVDSYDLTNPKIPAFYFEGSILSNALNVAYDYHYSKYPSITLSHCNEHFETIREDFKAAQMLKIDGFFIYSISDRTMYWISKYDLEPLEKVSL